MWAKGPVSTFQGYTKPLSSLVTQVPHNTVAWRRHEAGRILGCAGMREKM